MQMFVFLTFKHQSLVFCRTTVVCCDHSECCDKSQTYATNELV